MVYDTDFPILHRTVFHPSLFEDQRMPLPSYLLAGCAPYNVSSLIRLISKCMQNQIPICHLDLHLVVQEGQRTALIISFRFYPGIVGSNKCHSNRTNTKAYRIVARPGTLRLQFFCGLDFGAAVVIINISDSERVILLRSHPPSH